MIPELFLEVMKIFWIIKWQGNDNFPLLIYRYKKWYNKDLFGYSKRWTRVIGILEEEPGISYPKKRDHKTVS